MLLTVIIVSYNVKFFLRQCIDSLLAQEGIAAGEMEIRVVDNASPDGSVDYLQGTYPAAAYPQIHIYGGSENVGFSRANNQALHDARGRYTLFLNPDTVLPEGTLAALLAHMQEREAAGIRLGGTGVNMRASNGAFSPESKRGIPTPWVCFCKMLALHRLFPHSARFNGYYLGHLSADCRQEAPILSGAFFAAPTATLRRLGGFDEQFFMYGEDIDLSFRLVLDGCKNYYLPLPILHYKGESTRRQSLHYVKTFHHAMLLFYRKHSAQGSLGSGRQSKALYALVVAAIYARAGLAVSARSLRRAVRRLWHTADERPMDFLYLGRHAADVLPFAESHPLRITTLEGDGESLPDGHLALTDEGGSTTGTARRFVHAVYDLRDFRRSQILEIFSRQRGRMPYIGFYDAEARQIVTGGKIFTL